MGRWGVVLLALHVLACGNSPPAPSPAPVTPTPQAPAENRAPVITNISVSPVLGMEALTVFSFRVDAFDPDGDPLTYRWNFGSPPFEVPAFQTAFGSGGEGKAAVTITDPTGSAASAATEVFVVRTMDGTWRTVQTPFAGWVFTLTLQQVGAVVEGTYHDDIFGAGRTDPGEPGSVNGDGQFTLRLKLQSIAVPDFYLRGSLDASGQRASGTLQGSGFNGQAVVLDKIAN